MVQNPRRESQLGRTGLKDVKKKSSERWHHLSGQPDVPCPWQGRGKRSPLPLNFSDCVCVRIHNKRNKLSKHNVLPRRFRGKQSVCNAGNARDTVGSLGQEDPLEEKVATHPSMLENPVSRGAWQTIAHEVVKESDMTEQLSTFTAQYSLPKFHVCYSAFITQARYQHVPFGEEETEAQRDKWFAPSYSVMEEQSWIQILIFGFQIHILGSFQHSIVWDMLVDFEMPVDNSCGCNQLRMKVKVFVTQS